MSSSSQLDEWRWPSADSRRRAKKVSKPRPSSHKQSTHSSRDCQSITGAKHPPPPSSTSLTSNAMLATESVNSDITSATAPLLDAAVSEKTMQKTVTAPWVVESNALPAPLAYHILHNFWDVVFIFPFEKDISAPILQHARKADLMRVSSYFSTLFSVGTLDTSHVLSGGSKYVENVLIRDVVAVISAERAKGQPDFAYSEDEIHKERKSEGWSIPDDTPLSIPPYSLDYVTVRDTSAQTYKSFLNWLATGKIQNASLDSADATPVSLRYIYDLAHQLGIDALQELAVKDFEDQLNHSNVVSELFSSTCSTYPAFKDAAMKVLEREWVKVKESGGLKDILKMLDSEKADAKEIVKMALEILEKVPKLGD